MGFRVQASDPLIWNQSDTKVGSYYEAFKKIFEEYTEDAFLIWNDIPIRMTYSHDLYVNIYGIHMLLKSLLNSEKGSYCLEWGSDTFNATWNVEWENNNLKISSFWNSTSGRYEDLLNSHSDLKTERDWFLSEWKMLLRKIIDAINQSGIVITDREPWESFCEIESRIKNLGSLYLVSNN
jgi:hypothetical protein